MPTPLFVAVAAHEQFDIQRDPITPSTADLADYQAVVGHYFWHQANRSDGTDDTRVVDAYETFANELVNQWQYLCRRNFRFEFVDDDPNVTDQGFKTAAETFAEFDRTGVLRVFRSAGDHPLLDDKFVWYNGRNETLNTIFRAVHDVLGHFASGGSFGWSGETKAYYSHARLFSEAAMPALFSETVGQQCYYAVYKGYSPQVGVYFPAILYNPPIK